MQKHFLSLCILVVASCTNLPPIVTLDFSAIAPNDTFTMRDVHTIACDSFYVVTPYSDHQWEAAPFNVDGALEEKVASNATVREEIATLLFVKNGEVVDYAEVLWSDADFRSLPAWKGISMTEPLTRDSPQKVVLLQKR